MLTSNLNPEAFTIHAMPTGERPRERFLLHGAEAVSSIELLAIVLGSGTQGMPVIQLAQEILAKFGSLQAVAHATINELCQFRGLGVTKAIQLKASITLGLRAAKPLDAPKTLATTSEAAYEIIKESLEDSCNEKFMVVMLDSKCGVLGTEIVAIGTLSKTLVHPRQVFYPAIRHAAASVIIAHNHPSGDPKPSREDIETTLVMIDAGKMMAIPVQDHLIIGRGCYTSLRLNYPSLNF